MPRTARIAPGEHVYHVLAMGNNRQLIFHDDGDFIRYRHLLDVYKGKYSFLLYHYVLMPNHIHLVVETTVGGALSEIMKGINLSYASYYKKKYGHVGHFWQDRFKSILISKDRFLLACGAYVEANPVRAARAKAPGDYRWSSYSFYASGMEDHLVDMQPVYMELSQDNKERKKIYRAYMRDILKEQNGMRGAMDYRYVYGNDEFTDSLLKHYNIGAMIRPRGRPHKVEKTDR